MKFFHTLRVAEGFFSDEKLLVQLGTLSTLLWRDDVVRLRDHLNKLLEDAPPTT
jgi:hypothetical protein